MITLSFDQDAHIPKGTRFDVETIVKGSSDYKMYEEALKKKSRNLTGAAYYRLKLTKDGKEIHPKKPVEVSFFERIKTEKKVERAVFFSEGKKALKEDPDARLIAVESSEKKARPIIIQELIVREPGPVPIMKMTMRGRMTQTL